MGQYHDDHYANWADTLGKETKAQSLMPERELPLDRVRPEDARRLIAEAGVPLSKFANTPLELTKFAQATPTLTRKRVKIASKAPKISEAQEEKASSMALKKLPDGEEDILSLKKSEEELEGMMRLEQDDQQDMDDYMDSYQPRPIITHRDEEKDAAERDYNAVIPDSDGNYDEEQAALHGVQGRALNPGTIYEQIIQPKAPNFDDPWEEHLWYLNHPAPEAAPYWETLEKLRKVDEEDLEEKRRLKMERKALQRLKENSKTRQTASNLTLKTAEGDGGGNHFENDVASPGGFPGRKYIDIRFETSLGNFDVQCYVDFCPATSFFFARMVKAGFYNGLMFHRKIHDWLIQGGDPTGSGDGGQVNGLRFPSEIQPSLRHTGAGIIGLAQNDPLKPNTQFYITLGPTPPLDGRYCIFGRVSKGITAIQNMNFLPIDRDDRPQQWAQIYRAYIIGGEHYLSNMPRGMRFVKEEESEEEDPILSYFNLDMDRKHKGVKPTGDKKKAKQRPPTHEDNLTEKGLRMLGSLAYSDGPPDSEEEGTDEDKIGRELEVKYYKHFLNRSTTNPNYMPPPVYQEQEDSDSVGKSLVETLPSRRDIEIARSEAISRISNLVKGKSAKITAMTSPGKRSKAGTKPRTGDDLVTVDFENEIILGNEI